jgi:hypothetical protein
MRATLAVVASVAALLLSASSCSGDDPYGTLPPTTPATSPPLTTPTPTASPTPPEPTLPALATQDSPTGAESFARFYMLMLDYANHTGDTRKLRTLGDCAACRSQADGVERFFRGGGRIEGGEIAVESSKQIAYIKSTVAVVNVVYSQKEGRTIKSTGEAEGVAAQSHATYAFTLGWVDTTDAHWLVKKLQPVD